ncbi:MAG: class GN sortase [Thermoanaerobaculia bacterium]
MKRWMPVAALALIGAVCFGHGAWILVKAEIAQVLLGQAWERTLDGEEEARPWSWADTWPVARLEAPRHGAERIVLAGASGAVLAFGPGHLDGSAAPGADGNTVIAGHRDTHFEFLRDLETGDELWLESAAGVRRLYLVDSLRVVEDDDVSVLGPGPEDVLTLVTCYPFDAVVPGGPLRYVVRAVSS